MQFDASFINTDYTTNKIFTNTVGLSKKTPINALAREMNTTKDSFGSTKKSVNYILPKGFSKEIENLCRSLTTSLAEDLPHKNYDFHVLTKRVEFWQPKERKEDYNHFDAIRFTAVINHSTNKVWITPILTVIPEMVEEVIVPDAETPEETC